MLSVVILLCRKLYIFDMSENVLSVYQRLQHYGYLTFDADLKYMGCNEFICELFPFVKSFRVDEKIRAKNWETNPDFSFFDKNILEPLRSFYAGNEDEMDVGIIRHGDMYLQYTIRTLLPRNGAKREFGYLVELMDDTTRQKNIALMNEANHKLELEKQRALNYSAAADKEDHPGDHEDPQDPPEHLPPHHLAVLVTHIYIIQCFPDNLK